MTRGKTGKKSQKPELNLDREDGQYTLASELTGEDHKLATANDTLMRDPAQRKRSSTVHEGHGKSGCNTSRAL